MARAEGGIPGHRAASDRPAAVQQGEGGGGAVRRDRDGRPREDRRRAGRRRSPSRARRRGSTCRSIPARSRRRPASSRARRWRSSSAAARCTVCDRRADVHSASGRESRPAFRAAGKAGARGGRRETLHGHVGRLRDWRSPSARPACGSARRSSARGRRDARLSRRTFPSAERLSAIHLGFSWRSCRRPAW